MSKGDLTEEAMLKLMAERRGISVAELKAERQKASDNHQPAAVVDASRLGKAVLRSVGVPEGTQPEARVSSGCEVCDRTFDLEDCPWWPVEYHRLCDEHAQPVVLRHAEAVLCADPPRGIPKIQRTAREVPEEYRSWNPLDEDARGWYFHGGVGRGKSYLAAAMLKRVWMRWSREKGTPPTVAWWPTSRLLQQMRATFNGKGAPPDWIEALYKVDLLVLDDLGQERVTDWARETLALIITERYDAGRKLIITSNYSLGGLGRRFTPDDAPDDPDGERIASRIAEACTVREIKGPDRRILGN
jgi:DNA replication protein DnaC